jgi:hypothetical protein
VLTDKWEKSSYSGGSGGNCVEARKDGKTVQVRDSQDVDGAILDVDAGTWTAFLSTLR